jgi:hypothetical protein
MQSHVKREGIERKDISPIWPVVYGATAGYGLWARCGRWQAPSLWKRASWRFAYWRLAYSIYPIDGAFTFSSTLLQYATFRWSRHSPPVVIKSKIQTDGFSGDARKFSSTADCLRKVWRTQGVSGFTNGLGPTLIRSPFANAATFLGFELCMKAMSWAEQGGVKRKIDLLYRV